LRGKHQACGDEHPPPESLLPLRIRNGISRGENGTPGRYLLIDRDSGSDLIRTQSVHTPLVRRHIGREHQRTFSAPFPPHLVESRLLQTGDSRSIHHRNCLSFIAGAGERQLLPVGRWAAANRPCCNQCREVYSGTRLERRRRRVAPCGSQRHAMDQWNEAGVPHDITPPVVERGCPGENAAAAGALLHQEWSSVVSTDDDVCSAWRRQAVVAPERGTGERSSASSARPLESGVASVNQCDCGGGSFD